MQSWDTFTFDFQLIDRKQESPETPLPQGEWLAGIGQGKQQHLDHKPKAFKDNKKATLRHLKKPLLNSVFTRELPAPPCDYESRSPLQVPKPRGKWAQVYNTGFMGGSGLSHLRAKILGVFCFVLFFRNMRLPAARPTAAGILG